jgi:predicted nucleotidyltransferase
MKKDLTLNRIIKTLKTKHRCHTVILYGSRARGDFTSTSDYDVMGVSRTAKEMTRIARKVNGSYWDLWIFPEKKLRKPDQSSLYMKDGVVLIERNQFGTKLLKKLERIHHAGPKKPPKWETELKRTWLEKTYSRSRQKDPEGRFRRIWLIIGLLEDYFVLRGKWYEGSKASLAWLKENDPQTFKQFALALRSPHMR